MAWPYGIADPNLYAYIMNAMSQYPYAGLPPSTTSPLNYYASLGLQRAAAAYSPYAFPSPLRPRPDLLPSMASSLTSSPLLRPPHTPESHPTPPSATPSTHPCTLHSAREPTSVLGHSSSLLGGHSSAPPCSAASGEPCNCHLYYGSIAASVTTSLPAPIPISHVPTTPSAPTLFQPYKTDVERA